MRIKTGLVGCFLLMFSGVADAQTITINPNLGPWVVMPSGLTDRSGAFVLNTVTGEVLACIIGGAITATKCEQSHPPSPATPKP